DVAELADVLRDLGERAAARGVMLGIEPLNRFETSFLNTTRQAIELVDRVDHPAVGISLDLFHLGIEEKSPADALREAGDRLIHLQVAENDRGHPARVIFRGWTSRRRCTTSTTAARSSSKPFRIVWKPSPGQPPSGARSRRTRIRLHETASRFSAGSSTPKAAARLNDLPTAQSLMTT